jgi:hypothetical protein
MISGQLATIKLLAQRVKDIDSKAEKAESRDHHIRMEEYWKRSQAASESKFPYSSHICA